MKKLALILSFVIFLLPSCRKNNDTPTSGTATINNNSSLDPKLQTYIFYGFLFSSGKLVSILDTPPPDITITNDTTLNNLFFDTNNQDNSFFKVGEYNDANTAENVFNTLVSPVVLQWTSWADYLKPNQVWLYKSQSEHYAKLRIISTKLDVSSSKNYAECTFQWVYQPDGSLTFPGK